VTSRHSLGAEYYTTGDFMTFARYEHYTTGDFMTFAIYGTLYNW